MKDNNPMFVPIVKASAEDMFKPLDASSPTNLTSLDEVLSEHASLIALKEENKQEEDPPPWELHDHEWNGEGQYYEDGEGPYAPWKKFW